MLTRIDFSSVVRAEAPKTALRHRVLVPIWCHLFRLAGRVASQFSRLESHAWARLSFAKTPAVSKINSLRNFLRLAFCYEFDPCSTSYDFGSASSFAFFDLARL